ncbi:MAG: hypothetical protein Q7R30_07200 [Acidobacteriota bacterium]|nr:hypothetical protein [Acidobacteriota bacterium]
MTGRLALPILAAAVALAAAPSAQAPTSAVDSYATAVRTYVATGDTVKALTPIQAWAKPEFERAIDALIARRDQALIEAAAVLQVEIAVGVVMLSPRSAGTHLELGEKLIRSLRALPGPGPEAEFSEKWYAVAASAFLMVNDSRLASSFISRGLQLAPGSLDLRLMNGIVDDLEALSLNPDDSKTGVQRQRIATARTQAFLRARDRYARLVKDAPSFARARVRLGRVLWMIGQAEEARIELLRAQADARDPVQQYLSAMFLGALYEQEGDAALARAWYEEALSLAPASQAATVALGHLDVMVDRPDRARALARGLLSQKPVLDEWWTYNGGLETASLEWLRRRVRR